MAATVQAQIATGSGPSLNNAETGIKFNREDTQSGTTPIPIPTSTGSKYSWVKYLVLAVTATSSTTINNRRVSLSTTETAGLALFWKDQPTYTQANNTQGSSGGNYPADTASVGTGSDPATPAGYTRTTSTPALWDNTGVATSGSGKNGDYVQMVCGVSNSYAGGANSATSLPNILLTYDEA
jgi:hypothetical protein